MNGIRDLNFFLSFSAYLIPFWLKIMPRRGFFNFFQNFLARVEYERNSGLKFFFLFLDLSNPVLAKNNDGKRFFHFLISFSFFVMNFLARVEYERNSGLKFLSVFLSLSHPVLAKNYARKIFLIFPIFMLYFS